MKITFQGGQFEENELEGTGGAAHVTILPTAAGAGAVDTRIARFDAAADMPADITSSANVSADRIKFDTFSSTARRVRIKFHPGVSSANGTALAGPICTSAIVTINSFDDTEANNRLTYTDVTGGGTNSSGKSDTFMVSAANPIEEFVASAAISRIDVIGVPIGVTPTNIVPTFVEIQVIG